MLTNKWELESDPGLKHLEYHNYHTTSEIPLSQVGNLATRDNPRVYILFQSCAGYEVYMNRYLDGLHEASETWSKTHKNIHHDPKLKQNSEICAWNVRVFRAK